MSTIVTLILVFSVMVFLANPLISLVCWIAEKPLPAFGVFITISALIEIITT